MQQVGAVVQAVHVGQPIAGRCHAIVANFVYELSRGGQDFQPGTPKAHQGPAHVPGMGNQRDFVDASLGEHG